MNLSVYLSVGVSAHCDWLTSYYLRNGRHRPGLRLTSLGGLTKTRDFSYSLMIFFFKGHIFNYHIHIDN